VRGRRTHMLSVPPHQSDPSTARRPSTYEWRRWCRRRRRLWCVGDERACRPFPHTDPTSRPRAARPPTSGGGGGSDGDDFAWATNAPLPLGPPDGRIEGTLPRAHRCADADRARCAHAKVLNAPRRSCGYKTGYRRYRRRPRYSRPHPHHPQTVAPGTPQDPTLARLPLPACLKPPTSKQLVNPSPEATTRRVPQPVGYPLTRAVKTRGMPGSRPAARLAIHCHLAHKPSLSPSSSPSPPPPRRPEPLSAPSSPPLPRSSEHSSNGAAD
jgi:hypothetical protein